VRTAITPPMSSSSIERTSLVCEISIAGLPNVRLAVWKAAPVTWIWVVILRSSDVVVAEGVVESQLAAQVACQRAHEAWLFEKSRGERARWSGRYDWQLKQLYS
jgi:hypothetical protein